DGAVWTFGSPSFNVSFLTAQADRNGNQLTFTRTGTTGTLTTITDSVGRQVQFTYTGNRVTEILDPVGRRVTYAYDNNGRLATVLDHDGGTTRYTYDGQGRILTLTDARGITYLTNEYDSAGRVSKQTQADSGTWLFAYTTNSGVITQTTVTDPNGKQQTTRFNGQGYGLAQTDGQGQTTRTRRDPATNQVMSSTDALGRITSFEYDAAGNVTKITDPNNQSTRFEYEPTFNRVKKITDALNHITEFGYNAANGNLLTVKDPLLNTTTIEYNAFGQPTSVQGPIATEPPTTFVYDTNGNLITTTDPLGNATQRAYDAVSRLVNLTDPRQLQTQFRYDGLNRVTEIADARQGITRFGYDQNGNLLTVNDAKLQATSYVYDSMDRLKTRTDALTRLEQYVYDLAGNLTQFTDRKNQASTFTYDNLNRRTGTSYADSSSTSFTYDAVGRLSRTTDTAPGAGAIDFFYDNLDRLILEVTPQGAVAYEYDAIGRRTKMTVAGQAPVTYQYDAASRFTQVAQGSFVVGLGYDAAGRRTSLTYPNGTSTSYTYDNASRLLTITHTGSAGLIESLTYTYDVAGNRTSLTRSNGTASLLPNAVASATYDAANEQTAFAGTTLTYDGNGNLTSDGVNTYVWDARNRLVGISGGITASFAYDPLGRRVSKTVGSASTQFLYDGNDIAAEIGGAVGANYLRGLNIDEPFVRQSSTGNEHYHTDALGSSIALSNAQGASATTYTYEPFGKSTVTGASANPFQFTSRESDNTGLYFLRARYYSGARQRFLGEDPIRFGGGLNVYAYVENKPLGFVDPFGLDKNTKGCATEVQSTTVTNISISNDSDGPNLIVDLRTKGFSSGSTVSVNVNTGRLRSDQNPAGTNKVNFTHYASGISKRLGAVNAQGEGTTSVQIPISGIYPGQYVQIVPQRLADTHAPVITPDVGQPGQVRPSPSVDPQTNYDSKCQ
ncbi:MAG: RHS repeat-associated core domain-containing protein, partial [Nitrospiraceae bacterium]